MFSASLSHLSLDTLMRSALDGVFVVDRERKNVLFNEVCTKITGYSADEVAAQEPCCGDLMNCRDRHGRSLRGVLCPASAIVAGVLNSARQRMQIVRKDGTQVWVETIYSAVINPAGVTEYVLGVMRDISNAANMQDTSMIVSPTTFQAESSPRADSKYNLDTLLSSVETSAIRRALSAAGGHRHKAAELLGISRSRLYRRMDALQIDPNAKS